MSAAIAILFADLLTRKRFGGVRTARFIIIFGITFVVNIMSSELVVPDNVKMVISTLPVKDQGE
jgi:hypothetical protein